MIQHEDKTATKQMRSTPQIQVEEQSLTLKKNGPEVSTGRQNVAEQRLKENNRTQRYTMQQDKNTICRQN